MCAMTPEEAGQIAEDAYIYGYPLVVMEATRRNMTRLHSPDFTDQFIQSATSGASPLPATCDIASPSVDALISQVWLDLSHEPVILSIPETYGRYYTLQLLDAWTHVFAAPGRRTTGAQPAHVAIASPGWSGRLPCGVQRIETPTHTVWSISHLQIHGPDGVAGARALQRDFRLTPLSAWSESSQSPPLSSPPLAAPPRFSECERVETMTPAAFFRTLAALMRANPPHLADEPIITRLASLGVIPGQPFDYDGLDPAIQEAIGEALILARSRMQASATAFDARVNGWRYCADLGEYGVNYLRRAAAALTSLGAGLPDDILCLTTATDATGAILSGIHHYILHFAADETPPVNAFWSLTLYDASRRLVDNPLCRHALSDRDPLRYNPDGSLDLYFQSESPGPHREANWLPSPEGDFTLTLRLYWPKPQALDHTWLVPAVHPETAWEPPLHERHPLHLTEVH